MMNIYEVVTAMHQYVREAVEARFDCNVTSIEATAKTHYAPTKASKQAYIMSHEAMTFHVEAKRGFTEIICKVVVDSDGVPVITNTTTSLTTYRVSW